MGKINKKAGYIYSFILIVISVCIIAATEVIPKYLIKGICDELFPAMVYEKESYTALCELLPVFMVYEGEPEEDFYGEGYPDYNYSGYVWEESDTSDTYTADTGAAAVDIMSPSDAVITADDTTSGTETVDAASYIAGGTTYSMEQLGSYDFLTANCYTIASSTSITPDELDATRLMSMDMTVDMTGDDYKVLIYHTHGSEAYSDSREGITEDTVVGVGDELTSILETQYGVKVYHDRTAYDRVDGVVDTNYAYEMSAQGVDSILAMYPSIEVIIDLHRDGVKEDVYLVENVNGQPAARLMFVNGISRLNKHGDVEYLYNPYIQENLAFSMQLYVAGRSLYGDLFRKNYISGYRYNLHKMPKGALVEVGAQTNTVTEAKNAMGPLAETIYTVLSGN